MREYEIEKRIVGDIEDEDGAEFRYFVVFGSKELATAFENAITADEIARRWAAEEPFFNRIPEVVRNAEWPRTVVEPPAQPRVEPWQRQQLQTQGARPVLERVERAPLVVPAESAVRGDSEPGAVVPALDSSNDDNRVRQDVVPEALKVPHPDSNEQD